LAPLFLISLFIDIYLSILLFIILNISLPLRSVFCLLRQAKPISHMAQKVSRRVGSAGRVSLKKVIKNAKG